MTFHYGGGKIRVLIINLRESEKNMNEGLNINKNEEVKKEENSQEGKDFKVVLDLKDCEAKATEEGRGGLNEIRFPEEYDHNSSKDLLKIFNKITLLDKSGKEIEILPMEGEEVFIKMDREYTINSEEAYYGASYYSDSRMSVNKTEKGLFIIEFSKVVDYTPAEGRRRVEMSIKRIESSSENTVKEILKREIYNPKINDLKLKLENIEKEIKERHLYPRI